MSAAKAAVADVDGKISDALAADDYDALPALNGRRKEILATLATLRDQNVTTTRTVPTGLTQGDEWETATDQRKRELLAFAFGRVLVARGWRGRADRIADRVSFSTEA